MAEQNDIRNDFMLFKENTFLTDRREVKASDKTNCSNSAEHLNNYPERRGELVSQRQNPTANEATGGVPEISIKYVKRADKPFARGGFAKVYEAEWQNQSVALKVLRQNINASIKTQDLLHEANLATTLNHLNVVRVFGVVSIDGGKGLLMEKADRGSLRSALDATNKLSFEQLVSISIDIVDGLDYIHSKQMVHRDLKPENILLFDVKSQLTAKIADFGTSKVVQSLAGTPMIGTPYYMAPELIKPQVRYGSQVDVYSVAIVLYEVFSGRSIRDAYEGIVNPVHLLMCVASGQRPEMPESFPAELRTVVERGWSADANARSTLADFREALRRLKASTRNANPTASASISTSGSADVYAAFEAQVHKLQQSTEDYKLIDARSQIEACRRFWMRLDASYRTTATASTAHFHSLKGYVHHWFGECSDAYRETYQALTQLRELCLSGTSVEGEQFVTVLRYAVEVCWSQDQRAAAAVLVNHAARYTKSKLSAAAYADVLECFCYFRHRGDNFTKIAELLLSTRLKASANKPHVKVAIAHYYLAQRKFWDRSVALEHLNKAQHMINEIDAHNIWAAVCKSWKGQISRLETRSEGKLEEVRQCLVDALGIAERILGNDNNKTVSEIFLRLASTFKDLKRFDEAERMFKKAVEAAENSLGPNSWLVARTLQDLADMYSKRLKRHQEAEQLYLRLIEIYKSACGPGHWDLSSVYCWLADTYADWGQTEMAATYSQLKSEVYSGELEDKCKSIEEALNKLAEDVLRTHESSNKGSEASGELVDVLHSFFKVAPKPKPLLTRFGDAH